MLRTQISLERLRKKGQYIVLALAKTEEKYYHAVVLIGPPPPGDYCVQHRRSGRLGLDLVHRTARLSLGLEPRRVRTGGLGQGKRANWSCMGDRKQNVKAGIAVR